MVTMKDPFAERISDADVSQAVVEPIEGATTAEVNELSFTDSSAPHPAVVMSMSRVCILAVENESGYLVPIFTGADLLFELKKVWRAKH
jgi:hypothetical protein